MKTLPNQYVFNLQQKLVPTEYQSVLEHAYVVNEYFSFDFIVCLLYIDIKLKM
jgi:hypothetical protein